MTKQEFLAALRDGLSGLPQSEIEEHLGFYAEMIEDRMEDDLTEEEAVAAVGSPASIAAGIIADTPLGKLVRGRIGRRLAAWEIVLLILGAPIWLSLLIALLSVVLALYVSLWAVIVSLWSVFVALIGSAFGGLVGGIVLLCCAEIPSGLLLIAAALVCGGLAIFAFFGCKAATKGAVWLTKQLVPGIKKACLRKGEAQ